MKDPRKQQKYTKVDERERRREDIDVEENELREWFQAF
jgi:hypothetical protein